MGKQWRAVSLRSDQYLYWKYQTKERHSYPTYLIQVEAEKEKQKELRFITSEQDLVRVKEGTETGSYVLAHPLPSPLGLWMYV